MRAFPERRQQLRVVTLKNAAWLFAGLLALFIIVSTFNELRPGNSSRERLYEQGSSAAPPPTERGPAKAAAKAVEQQPVVDQTSTARRNAHSLMPSPPPTPPAAPVAIAEPPHRLTLKEARQRGERIVVTGGSEGVRVQATPAPPPAPEITVPPLDRF
jgi:hypothetical protein